MLLSFDKSRIAGRTHAAADFMPIPSLFSLHIPAIRHCLELGLNSTLFLICCIFVLQQIQAAQHFDMLWCCGFLVGFRFEMDLGRKTCGFVVDFQFVVDLSACCTTWCTTNPQQIEVNGVWALARLSETRLRFSGVFPLTLCAIQIYLLTYLA